MQPLSYTRGLARAAQQAGARIHERSMAGTPQRGGGQWVVSTATGSVRADKVIIGTNGYTDLAGAQGPWPKLARTVIPVYSYIAATRPLSDDLRRTILPKGQAVSDSRRLLRYFRLDAAGRMVMGGRGRTRDSAERSDYASIIASAVELYPQLRGFEWEFVWGGKVAVTLDHLPHLHELAPGVHAALGYNGRGVAMATVMGKVLADRVQGRGAAVFPESPLRPVPLHRWRRPVFELIVAWKRALDRMEGVHRRAQA